MIDAQDLSDREPEEIKQEIEVTKAALSEKLEILESEVKETVEDAKTKVRETVEEVRRAFDIRHQIRTHPWIGVGGAVVIGAIVGRWLAGTSDEARGTRSSGLNPENRSAEESNARCDWSGCEDTAAASAESRVRAKSRARGMVSRLADQFDDELRQLKGIAMGVAVGMIGDLARKSAPKFSEKIGEVFESAAGKLGFAPKSSSNSAREDWNGHSRSDETKRRRSIDPNRTDVV